MVPIVRLLVLSFAIFVSGAVVMIFEMLGSRILAAEFGMSVFVWTSIIGIILLALSIGYYFGGRLADKGATFKVLSIMFFFASVSIFYVFLSKEFILELVQYFGSAFEMKIIFVAAILFTPASILLGMSTPYIVRLSINDIATSGRTIGKMYAISNTGGIFGIFFAGFWLIPHFGINSILLTLSLTLMLLSLMFTFDTFFKQRFYVMFAVYIIAFFITPQFSALSDNEMLVSVDSAYGHILVFDRDVSGDKIRQLRIDNNNSSAMLVGSNELVYEYTKYYHLARYFNPNFNKSLMIGGGAYSFPKNYLAKYADAEIDVIEIDPVVTEIAREYFVLEDGQDRLNILHTDGRHFLNNTNNKYDVIFGDAFSDNTSIPHQLTTAEVIQKKYDILSDGGVVISNVLGSIDGGASRFVKSVYLTHKSIFPQVYLFAVRDCDKSMFIQNFILVASKSNQEFSFYSDDDEIDEYLKHVCDMDSVDFGDAHVLTDDFAPVEYYANDLM